MKKTRTMNIILLTAAALTVVLFIMAVVMLKAVRGDALFYMDSGKGHFYAVSYRWVCLAEGLLLLFWIVLGFRKRKAILEKLPRVELKKKQPKPAAEAKAGSEEKAIAEVKADSGEKAIAEVKTGSGEKAIAESGMVADVKEAVQREEDEGTETGTEPNVTADGKPADTEIETGTAAGEMRDEKRFCTSCGKQISTVARFCPSCGAAVGQKKL
ncbi:zinc-ribbon domain-containing protein [Acetatifactor muris]|uniref:zinc-ribbon domain-containing protein n=1 Tax=Acetatifactor muris TaxID=879566 RepID=UPI0023F571FF|nr:zinc-ribbon domain-containing protein [Acetatifactor muris]